MRKQVLVCLLLEKISPFQRPISNIIDVALFLCFLMYTVSLLKPTFMIIR